MTGPPFPLNITDDSLRPVYRRLRGYAFDPSFAIKLDSLAINTVVYPVRWEKLDPGPIGEYIEVIDIDPASGVFYPPVDLNAPQLMAQDGLPPSESNPQFHQQMVYAVAMTTVQNFEKALGRPAQWSSTDYNVAKNQNEGFVKRLRIYPHALRDANAYYSPDKKAVLFGYFAARANDESALMRGSLVFTCLSHDIISHEVTHALIDGIYKGYAYPVHIDTLGLHEAFSDLVALFQHFTFQEILIDQIAKTRGELKGPQLLSELAQQFGLAVGNYSSLRDAIGRHNEQGVWEPVKPDPKRYRDEREPHARGSILVAAVFDAFLNIYRKRTADLYRIASDGTGILPEGQLSPDLVRRLAYEAARTAKQFLSLCIRALDYCPPIGATFGEYLRALITADVDLVPDDQLGYRVSLIESFKRWGIYPDGIRTLSVDNLTYYANTTYDILGLSPSQQAKRQEVEEDNSFRVNFFQRLDNITLETYFLQADVRPLARLANDGGSAKSEKKTETEKQKQKEQKRKLENELIEKVRSDTYVVLDKFDSLKNNVSEYARTNELAESSSNLHRVTYTGDLKMLSNTEDPSATATREKNSIKLALTQPAGDNPAGFDLWLYQFWYLCQRFYNETARHLTNRERLFLLSREYKVRFHQLFSDTSDEGKKRLQTMTGIFFQPTQYADLVENGKKMVATELNRLPKSANPLIVDAIYQPRMQIEDNPRVSFEVHTLHRAQRVGPDTNVVNQVVLTLMQRFQVSVNSSPSQPYEFSGGCTMVMNIDQRTTRLIVKGVLDPGYRGVSLDAIRLANELRQRYRPTIAEKTSPFAASRWPAAATAAEPFALLHQRD